MTRVCPHCFDEKGLKRRIEEIRPTFPDRKCSFHPRYKGVPIRDVAEIVDHVFRNHYGTVEYHQHMDEPPGDELTFVVAELVEAVDEEIAESLVEQLIEIEGHWAGDGGDPFYAELENYVPYEPEDYYHSDLWNSFCESVVHNQRFFNTDAKDLIQELFDEIHFQRDHQRQTPVYQVKPGDQDTTFHRARIVNPSKQSDISKNPAGELGPPPKRLRSAGRMNPAGVASFYGAFDIKTCIAELRPAVGLTVVGAKFELVRPIYVLDTTRFEAPIRSLSLFSKKYIQRVQQWKFMQNFMREIAKPILPNDEHLDYIPTQAVAEYLLHHHKFKRNGVSTQIEGIIYRSAQYPGGKNIVLLGDAASVIADPTKPARSRPKRSRMHEIVSEPVASFMTESTRPKNPGLRIMEESVHNRYISGARYDSAELREHIIDPDEQYL